MAPISSRRCSLRRCRCRWPQRMSPRRGPLRAQALHKLVFGDVSRTGASWQLLMAETAGFFAAEKLTVEFVFTGSTATVAQQLIGGSFDLATPTVETVIRAVEQGAPLTIVGSSMLHLPYAFMASPAIGKPSDLRGKKIILDLPKSVLSWVWKNWSQANGLGPDDVEIVYDGSSTNRLAALVANVVVVAPVNQPLDMMALDRGYKKLIEVPTYAPARTFGFTSIAARTDWVAANGDALRAFLRAEARGIDYLYDPKNRERMRGALSTFARNRTRCSSVRRGTTMKSCVRLRAARRSPMST